MKKLIDRNLGYSDYDMWQYCESLKSIMMTTKDTIVGRGKAKHVEKTKKYLNTKEEEQRIIDSCEHYKGLHEKKGGVEFRDYQLQIIEKGTGILLSSRFLYLAMEVRTGKTLTSLGIADKINADNVLFITKKKAISSILKDFELLSPSFSLCVINYESLHTIDPDTNWDLVICDEAHGMGAFPKPSNRAEAVRDLIDKNDSMVILLSGTPTPESYSQMYHQVYGIPGNPFQGCRNFYKFAQTYVKVKQRKVNGMLVNDYSNGLDTIIELMKPYTINYTQAQAGFLAKTIEEVLYVEMKPSTYSMIKRLKKDLVIEGKTEVILADTPVKLMMKVHQLCSGTIKFESGASMIVDSTKAEFIKNHFTDCKIGIFYKFKEELEALKQVFGDELTTELSVFEDTNKNIALQIVSGREGISLKEADYLVYYNIDFSATSYWQSKDRMTTKDRKFNHVYWVFSKDGIEEDIYKAVTKKKDYTLKHFQNEKMSEL